MTTLQRYSLLRGRIIWTTPSLALRDFLEYVEPLPDSRESPKEGEKRKFDSPRERPEHRNKYDAQYPYQLQRERYCS